MTTDPTEPSLRSIINRIQKLSGKEKSHVLKLLRNHKIEYTKNSNGYFFDLGKMGEPGLRNLNKCIDSIETNRHQLDQMNKRRDELVTYYQKVIHERMQKANRVSAEAYMDRIRITQIPCNIKMTIQKRGLKAPDTRDPDDILREASQFKYSKDSIFYKMDMRMRAQRQRRNAERNRSCIDDTEDYHHDQEADPDMDFADVDVDEDLDENGDIDMDLGDMDLGDMDPELDQDLPEQEVEPDGDDPDALEVDEADVNEDADPDADADTDTDTDTQTQIEMDYFKKVLNKKGFQFDDNKNCYLVYQEYIDILV